MEGGILYDACLLLLRDGSRYQIGWIFSSKGRGGSHFQSKNLYCRFWELNRAFWAWNWHKRVISWFRVCFSQQLYWEKSKHALKKALLNPPFGAFLKINLFWRRPPPKGRVTLPNQMNFRKGSKQPLTPTPCPSEWSLSLEIVYMHFILSGPHTSLHVCNHIHYGSSSKRRRHFWAKHIF